MLLSWLPSIRALHSRISRLERDLESKGRDAIMLQDQLNRERRECERLREQLHDLYQDGLTVRERIADHYSMAVHRRPIFSATAAPSVEPAASPIPPGRPQGLNLARDLARQSWEADQEQMKKGRGGGPPPIVEPSPHVPSADDLTSRLEEQILSKNGKS